MSRWERQGFFRVSGMYRKYKADFSGSATTRKSTGRRRGIRNGLVQVLGSGKVSSRYVNYIFPCKFLFNMRETFTIMDGFKLGTRQTLSSPEKLR